MQPYNHSLFIQTPIKDKIQQQVASFAALGDSIVVYAIQESFMNSLFLQLTGALEQKSKCICWMLSQYNLEYRRTRFFDGWKLSECSKLNEKTIVYKDLLEQTRMCIPNYKVFTDMSEKRDFVNKIRDNIYTIFDGTNLVTQRQAEYDTFKEIFDQINISNIDEEGQLIKQHNEVNPDKIKDNSPVLLSVVYQLLYIQRNRNAHNTTSYQENLPDIRNLLNINAQRYSNMFLFITVLVLIDELYRRVYEKYISTIITF